MLKNKKTLFAREYLATGDARLSAERAGYKDKSYGYKLLKDKEVTDYLREFSSDSSIATAEEVLAFLTSVMRGEEWEIKVSLKKDTGEKVVQGEPPALSQRQKAAELLAKRYRLFSEEPPENSGNEPFCVNIRVLK